MTQDVLQQYSAAAELLDAQDVMATPAELHGVLCGMLCGGAPLRRDAWLQEFNELVNDGVASAWTVTNVAPASQKASKNCSGGSTMRWTSRITDGLRPASARTIEGPYDRFGTK